MTDPAPKPMPTANRCPNPECNGSPVTYFGGQMVCDRHCGYRGPVGWYIPPKKPRGHNPQWGGYAVYSEPEAIRLHNLISKRTEP